MTVITWDTCTVSGQQFVVAKTSQGVCCIDIVTENGEWKEIIKRHRKDVQFEKGELHEISDELVEYLTGKREVFSFPIDLAGTDFQLDVWHAAYDVPYGETKSYRDIAVEINRPKAVRAVGAALGANPILFVVPCHRIIALSGKLTGYRAGIALKRQLLTLENKAFTPK